MTNRLHLLWIALLLGMACTAQPARTEAGQALPGEEVNSQSIDFRIRKGQEGILVLRQGKSGMYWYIMNESDPRRMTLEDVAAVVQYYAASRKEKSKPAAYNIDADEDLAYSDVGPLIRALRAAGIEKFTLSSGILKN